MHPGFKRLLICGKVLLAANTLFAQQFNSDSWLSKPEGTVTIIPTFGQRNYMLMNTFSLVQNWEFTLAAFLYNDDSDPSTDDGYSSTFYGKYMFYENKAKTGGAAVKFGTGLFPGQLNDEERVEDAFRSFWMNAPVTIPLLNNKFSVDLMPGASVTYNYGVDDVTAGSFTYSTRVAWYPWNPELSLVGEVFGAEGRAPAPPEYKIGPRWEPTPYAVFALTYGDEFDGNNGSGFEFGIMLFTPPFACLGGCK